MKRKTMGVRRLPDRDRLCILPFVLSPCVSAEFCDIGARTEAIGLEAPTEDFFEAGILISITKE
jgi:hypothetical protein